MSPDLVFAVAFYINLIFALCIHEAAHAASAVRFGDDTPRYMGRLTLNPIKHLDPIGSVILPLILLMSGGMMFGWAKSVQFNPRNLKNPTTDTVLIAMAGPASNLLLALLFAFSGRAIFSAAGGIDNLPSTVEDFFVIAVMLNFILMVFNLIPIFPLDGHYLLNLFLPPNMQETMRRVGPFGILIALVLGMQIFAVVLPPVRDFVQQVLAG